MSYTRFRKISATQGAFAVGAKGAESDFIDSSKNLSVAGITAKTVGGGIVALTPAATVSLDPTLGTLFTLTPGENETINAASVPAASVLIVLRVLTSGATSRTLTFGTNFKATGTLATGTADAKQFTVTFMSDGTNLVELSRTTAM